MLSSVPPVIIERIREVVQANILDFDFVGGGCINKSGRLNTSKGLLFLKWNDLKKYPGMFAAEAQGLRLLHKANVIHIPEVIHSGMADPFQYLLLEFIEHGPRSNQYWINLGRGLARIHQQKDDSFGLPYDNYIGSLPQYNSRSVSWINFFIQQRLEIQLKLAVDAQRMDSDFVIMFEMLYAKLPDLLTEEPPVLLHGDLWNGNIISNHAGEPCLIDPAVYFGHREVDLAMTQLFGGFDKVFLEAYANTYPLVHGFMERFDIYNLYPLLVHVNLFGGGYKSRVISIVKRYV
ncbi:MAG: fructosamine kinase family protein [Cyclobacteriaceae bacterium]